MLKVGSGISDEVIVERGYFTITEYTKARALGLSSVQAQVPALAIPIYNVHGEMALTVSRPDSPRQRAGKPVKYEWPSGQPLVLSVPPRCREHLDDPDVPLWITEGDKKADALASHGACAISLNGVSGGRGTNPKGGKTRLPCWDSIALNEREVILAFDSDSATKPQVMRQLASEAAWLTSRKARVRVLYLPHKENGEKQGVDDFLASGHELADLKQYIRDEVARVAPSEGKDGLPNIVVNGRYLAEIAEDAWRAAIAVEHKVQRVFIREEALIRIALGDSGSLTIRKINLDEWIGLVERAAHFVAFNPSSGVMSPSRLPLGVARDMLAAFRKPADLPRLKGIAEAPFFAPSGRLVSAQGYDPDTGIFCNLPADLRDLVIPEVPSDEQVRLGVSQLQDLIHDFPFVSEADRTNALAFMLTPFVRPHFDDISPACLVTATTKGSGKGLLIDVVTIIATGRECQRIAMPFKSEEETDKRFISLLDAGERHVHIDNVEGVLDSPVLALFLTAREYGGRVLGTTNSTVWAQRIQVHVSGNNLQLGGDIPRRGVPIRLAPDVERPDLKPREDFQNPDLINWTKDHRRELVAAALTIVQNWFATGGKVGPQRLGSYERWSGALSGILSAAGVEAFLANREEALSEADAETDAWHALIEAWWDIHQGSPITASAVGDMLHGLAVSPFREPMAGESKHGRQTRLGMGLAKARNRVVGRFRIELCGKEPRSKAALWKLIELSPSRGTSSPQPPTDSEGSAEVPRDNSSSSNLRAVSTEPTEPTAISPNNATDAGISHSHIDDLKGGLEGSQGPTGFRKGACVDCAAAIESRFARCEECTQKSFRDAGGHGGNSL
ncbi:hypothetical protein AYO38_05590 [bacterium SCGC AG-212-C10]|nr:hypothetical protein AYO38_05590 [bacterium SCGC AG-212-C10]